MAKQERLEAATYRVGQLESQVKNMVPMLDYNKKQRELEEAQKSMEIREVENHKKLAKVENQLKSERVAKWIYLSLVSVLLVVQPILFFLWAFA
ncbi:hypothetical protein IPJ72_06715 [Candidatus Peregrinibacteria bacterium]|nr:MAG: hypothetical protein IPJ72_06715 [Candidatus Peregrinibacteria bacterium]